MSASTYFRVHRIDDQTVIQICREVMEVFAEYEPSGVIQKIPGLNTTIDEDLDDGKFAGKYSIPIASVSVNLGDGATFSMGFKRSITDAGNDVPSALYNQFQCNWGRDASSWRNHIEKADKVQEILGRADLPAVAGAESSQDGVLRELLVGFGAQHRSMLESLDTAIEAAEQRRQELDVEAANKAAQRREEHDAALEELEKQRFELERQSHMAERRRLLRQLTEATGDRVRTSIAPRGAILARWGVFATALLLSACTAWLAISSFAALGAPVLVGDTYVSKQEHDALDWILLVRAVISSAVSVGALIYAASWLRGFYNADLTAAREIERFTYDLNRASWVIETILEVQQENKGEVPEAWVEGVTRGLFDDRKRDEAGEATNALRALLAYTASASIGPDGPRFDLNRKGARELAKETS